MAKATDFRGRCDELRKRLKDVAVDVYDLKTSPIVTSPIVTGDGLDKEEMIANLMLAYRHLEDARMRVGKAIQAFDGGVSVYDPPKPTE